MWRAETTKAGLVSIAAISLALAVPAAAQDDSGQGAKRPAVSRNAPPSSNATINLINLLVKQGVLGEDQAATLIKQADDEAYVARQAVRDAATKAEGAEKKASTAVDATSPPGTKRVTYVPEIVKQQLREEIKRDVMAKAEKENWASPGKYPEWAQRIRFYGDIRARYEGDLFPPGNGPLENFNAINTGSPFQDVGGTNNPYFPPTYNTTEDRNRFRFRARLGLDADLFDGFTAGLRIATGENNSPVSTNQTFGANGGNFSKYALWLDRAFVKYQPWGDLSLSVGRFDNPFWSPTDLVWYKELGFDGVAIQAKHEIAEGITPFVVGGAFPTYNTDLNAGVNLDTTGTNVPTKFVSHDKWLFGGQAGLAARLIPESDIRFAVAYYDFTNVQGKLSSLCFVDVSSSDICDTDMTRPSFAQKGNTYMQLRNNLFLDSSGASLPNFQYYGLASQFRPLVASSQLDLAEFNPVHIILDGEFVWNTAFDRNAIAAVAVNNLAPAPGGVAGPFNGGNIGWLARLTVGNKEVRHLWDWNAHVGYKYLESDATVDAFVDSDFGLGGTNLKGYFIGANLGLGENVWATARWMSANGIAGLPYAVDVFQLDLNARF
jgi:hypothetical protein